MKSKQFISILFLSFLFFIVSCTRRMENLNPDLSQRIVDSANLFSEQERDSLFKLIHNLSISCGPQIGIATIDSLNGEAIEDFSRKVRGDLKLGRKNYKDGLLFAVSIKDKIIRIDVGDGLVHIIPDEKAKWINRELMIPEFEQGQYFNGLLIGLTYTVKLIEDNKELIGKF